MYVIFVVAFAWHNNHQHHLTIIGLQEMVLYDGLRQTIIYQIQKLYILSLYESLYAIFHDPSNYTKKKYIWSTVNK